jgi:hypothetical protein
VSFPLGAMRTSFGSAQTFLAEWFVVRFPRATYRRACELPTCAPPRSRKILAAFAAHKDEPPATSRPLSAAEPSCVDAHCLYLAPLGTFESQQGSAVEEDRLSLSCAELLLVAWRLVASIPL